MKKEIPFILTLLAGLYFVVDYFIPNAEFKAISTQLKVWVIIIIAFTYILGVGNVLQIHLRKVARQEKGWMFSVITVVPMLTMIFLGVVYPGDLNGTAFVWMYDYIYSPMQAAMFSLLAFYIASASFRAFRVRNVEATLLAVTAIIVMLGRVSDFMWADFSYLVEWIMGDLQVVGKRAIMIGAALGAIATGIKVILGIEKSFLSGD
jgi:hypothetical protein